MNNKSLFLVVFVILSASIVFAMGKVDAVDSGTTAIAAPTATAVPKLAEKRYSFIDVNKAQSDAEKRRILLEMIKSDPETEEDWAIAENNQFKRDAAYELLSLKPTREDIRAIVDQIYKEKYKEAKKELMDAISNSTYLEITLPAYKKITKNDEDIYIKGLAAHFYIKLGDQNEGYELMKELFDYMNLNNQLAYYYNGVNSFTNPQIKEKVKSFLIDLKDDTSKGDIIRSYAAIICQQKYNTGISEYYPVIERAVLKQDIKKSAATYLISKLKILSVNEAQAKKIIDGALETGNLIVKETIRNNYKNK